MWHPLARSGAAALLIVLFAALLGGCPVFTRGSREAPAEEAGDGE